MKDLCIEFNILQFFSKKGCPYNNACIESFHASIKKEEVYLNLINFEVWNFYSYEGAIFRMEGLKKRYPEGKIVPFAKRNDNDDIACFDIETREVYVIHDFSTNGYKNRIIYESFEKWFKVCIENMFEYINEEIKFR